MKVEMILEVKRRGSSYYITIPKEIAKNLGIKEGSKVRVEIEKMEG